MQKFDFSIKTRDGQKIDTLVIGGVDRQDAEHKLYQMYHYCEILSCVSKNDPAKQTEINSLEEILTLISK